MPKFQIKTASRQGLWLKMALMGPTGSGKTYSALAIASGLGKRVCVIDTERGSASLYSDQFAFDVIDDFEDYNPKNYIEAMNMVVKAGYDVLIIDSLSHAWSGKGGILEIVDDLTASSKSHNAYTAGWPTGTRLHNELMNAILSSPIHIIATMRSKMDYVLQDEGNGKKAPAKVGLAPVQRDGVEYEFTVIGDINLNHTMSITKTRIKDLDGQMVRLPGAEFGASLIEWLGTPPPPKPEPVPAPKPQPVAQSPAAAPKPAAEPPAVVETAVDPVLADARERVYSRLRVMVSENQNGYDEVPNVLADVKAALRVDKVSICDDVDLLNNFYEWLGERRHSETPWVRTPYKVLIQPQVQKLLDKIDAEVTTGRVIEPESVKETFLKSAMNMAELNDEAGLKTLLKQVKTFAPVSKEVPADVAQARSVIHDLFKIMVANNIDDFSVSSRLTNSVKDHLGVDRLDKCMNTEKMLAYAQILRQRIVSAGLAA